MRRREFNAGLGGAVVWPLTVQAQQAIVPTVELLVTRFRNQTQLLLPRFARGSVKLVLWSLQTSPSKYRHSGNDVRRLPELAADLINRRVAVIATLGGPVPARAVRAASASIPIVFEIASDPVQAGLVASLNRPGRNATGVAILSTEIETKRLELLHELLPRAKRFAVMINPSGNVPAVVASRASELEAAADTMGVRIDMLYATNSGEINKVFSSLAQNRAEALLVVTSPLFSDRSVHIATLAARYALPAMYFDRHQAAVGGLISYGASYPDQARQVGIYVGRILKGERAASLPVMRPTKFDLVINLQTAKALRLEIPTQLLPRADEVIE
jgi:putative tryptophan/tyrosine transport system substrate-binding protein